MLADIVWLGFMICSGLRMFSYIPRIWRIAADKTGAAAISYTMWGLWTAAYVTSAVYAAAGLHNIWRMHNATAMACLSLAGVGLFAAVLLTVGIRAFDRRAVR